MSLNDSPALARAADQQVMAAGALVTATLRPLRSATVLIGESAGTRIAWAAARGLLPPHRRAWRPPPGEHRHGIGHVGAEIEATEVQGFQQRQAAGELVPGDFHPHGARAFSRLPLVFSRVISVEER